MWQTDGQIERQTDNWKVIYQPIYADDTKTNGLVTPKISASVYSLPWKPMRLTLTYHSWKRYMAWVRTEVFLEFLYHFSAGLQGAWQYRTLLTTVHHLDLNLLDSWSRENWKYRNSFIVSQPWDFTFFNLYWLKCYTYEYTIRTIL